MMRGKMQVATPAPVFDSISQGVQSAVCKWELRSGRRTNSLLRRPLVRSSPATGLRSTRVPLRTQQHCTATNANGKRNAAQGSQEHSLLSAEHPGSNLDGDAGAGFSAGFSQDKQEIFTKFLDDQLLQFVDNPNNPVRQTVLLTDGTDTRACRLPWPSPSLIFQVSPGSVESVTSRVPKGIRSRVPKSSLVQHISMKFLQEDWEDEELVQKLVRKGYRGDKPSAWVLEIMMNLSENSLKSILGVASSLLMKGSMLVGVLPVSLIRGVEEDSKAFLRNIFASQGFTPKLYSYEELASKWSIQDSEHPPIPSQDMPLAFVTHQQRLSDVQVEIGRIQLEQAEEVDEDGFEDSW